MLYEIGLDGPGKMNKFFFKKNKIDKSVNILEKNIKRKVETVDK
jgi:hypothetical protein